LKWARKKYQMQQKLAFRARDSLAAAMIKEWGGTEGYVRMQKDYTNDRLKKHLVYNTSNLMVEWKGRLVRKIAPVYQIPRSRLARAHLFSPKKRVGSLEIDTYWFNLVVIWLLSLIFYFTLIYDLLRKVVSWNQIRKLRKVQ
jgi:hypothetical protein